MSNVNLLRLCIVSALYMMGMTFSGCDKSEQPGASGYSNFKVYYDTLANGQSPSVGIDAGNGRMFMTYGNSSFGVYINGAIQYQNIKTKLLATDNNGDILWKVDLPEAMTQAIPVALDDGGCLVAMQTWFGENPDFTERYVYISRYDRYGNNTKVDSVELAPAISNNPDYAGIFYLRAYKTPDGRIIFFGDCYYLQTPTTSESKALMFEYSPNSGLVWIKGHLLYPAGVSQQFNYPTGCIQTAENGLLFAGCFSAYDSVFNYSSHPLLIKTNAVGDTIWTRRFASLGEEIYSANIIEAPNGNYRFCFNTGYGTATSKTKMYVYEVNANGDSVSSVKVDNRDQNVPNVIVPTENGGFFALVNNAPGNVMGASSNQFYSESQTRKLYFDAQMKKISDTHFQTVTTDFLPLACRTSDGDIACFGIQQPVGRTYYLPHLYLLK